MSRLSAKRRAKKRNHIKMSSTPEEKGMPQLFNDLQIQKSAMNLTQDDFGDNQLASAKTYWFFGEWAKLADLGTQSLDNHPQKERMALLVASANQQLGNHDVAREMTQVALDWGCPKRVVAQIMVAGVHNTLGRIAAIKEDEARIVRHFEASVSVAGVNEKVLIGHARSVREMGRMGLLSQAASLVEKELRSINTRHHRPSPEQFTCDFKELVELCLNSEDVHAEIDKLLATKKNSRKETFGFLCELSDRFFADKDNATALHFLATARECLHENDRDEQLLLSRKFMKLGAKDEALGVLVQHSLNANDLNESEKNTLFNFYENSQSAIRSKKEHGHEVLLAYMKTHLAEIKSKSQVNDKQAVLIEIGTTRENVPGQGSTRKLAEFCKTTGIHFITVDMDPHNTLSAVNLFEGLGVNFDAVTQKGEDYLRDFAGEFDFVFLDAYDFDHGNHSELRQSRYKLFLGSAIDEQKCHQMHLDCAESVLKKLSPDGVVCVDDTWLDDGKWSAKGTLAVPYLLENGFELLEARNRSALLRRI